ncbi:MAG: hypothetical protein ACFCU7_18840 [Pleurocapsa sp.]
MESAENREQPRPSNELKEDQENNDAFFSKTETLKLLNDSIKLLEQTIKGIKEDSAPIPPSDSINTLLTTTQKLADAAIAKPNPNSVPIAEATVAQNPEVQAKTATAPITAKSSIPSADKTSLKPQPQTIKKNPRNPKNRKKINLSLIVIGVTTIAIAIVAIFWLWLPRQQSKLASMPEPTTTETVTKPDFTAEDLKTPLVEPQLDDSQTDAARIPIETPANPEPASALEPLVIPIPQDLESPGRVKNLKIVAIKPELNFTPEQTLIAALEKKITELTQVYPSELIDSIKVNLSQNSLLVKVTDNWYELEESRQNKLANEILKRSRNLSFSKLELEDNQGTLVARNPVIGNQIIILQNSKINEQITTSN